MRSTILLLTSLLTTSLALPQNNQHQRSDDDSIFIIQYDPGCGTSAAGCLYSFNLTINQADLSISTSCDGTDISGDTYGSCGIPSVTSHEYAQEGYDTLVVNYTYISEDVTYKDVGSINITDFETAGQYFTVVPTTILGE